MGFREEMQAVAEELLTDDFPQADLQLQYRDNDGTPTEVYGPRFKPSYNDIDGDQVKSTSAKFLIIQSRLAIEPVVGHAIYDVADDREYLISKVTTDAVNAVWYVYGDS